MRLAVVGHVEWVEFARVERVPKPGEIAHALEAYAGGGPLRPRAVYTGPPAIIDA